MCWTSMVRCSLAAQPPLSHSILQNSVRLGQRQQQRLVGRVSSPHCQFNRMRHLGPMVAMSSVWLFAEFFFFFSRRFPLSKRNQSAASKSKKDLGRVHLKLTYFGNDGKVCVFFFFSVGAHSRRFTQPVGQAAVGGGQAQTPDQSECVGTTRCDLCSQWPTRFGRLPCNRPRLLLVSLCVVPPLTRRVVAGRNATAHDDAAANDDATTHDDATTDDDATANDAAADDATADDAATYVHASPVAVVSHSLLCSGNGHGHGCWT